MSFGVAIEVGIGLILMYLLLGLFVTAINEFVAQFASIRARHLKSALRHMLGLRMTGDDTANLALFTALTSSPVFQIAGEISKTTGSGTAPSPSYMNRDSFLAALREAIPKLQLKDAQGATLSAESLRQLDIKGLIEALPKESGLRASLLAVIGDAGATAKEAEKRVGDWFDSMMERGTGAYKRWMSVFSLVLGLALAIGFNCDTIRVAQELGTNATLREAVVKTAEDIKQRCQPAAAPADVAKPAEAEKAAAAKAKAACEDVRKNLDALQTLPVGWKAGDGTVLAWGSLSIIGWVVTALAVSLGAPFWFDVLSKFMNVRGALKTPAK
ncbi:MAG: hypothetical protein IPK81_12850 [Rhodospirillales bacterium]|nr:MAG: hypothetical protein IPK81_12850 [Rhodospirillales bacterium]